MADQHSHEHQHQHGHSHSHGHGHGHGHTQGEGEGKKTDEWDGQAYLARPGVKETSKTSCDSTLYALSQIGLSPSQTKELHLLEVGSGAVTSLLLPHFSSIHAIDVSPSMLLALSSNLSAHSNLSWSLHSLNPSSADEFRTPLLSPTTQEQERRLTPPRAEFDVAIANVVIHHVHDFPPFFQGVLGLLKRGGWFIATEFGAVNGRDIAGEVRKATMEEDAKKGVSKHGQHHHIHPSFSTETITSLFQEHGLVDVKAEIRGVLPIWPGKPEPPCLIAWGRKP